MNAPDRSRPTIVGLVDLTPEAAAEPRPSAKSLLTTILGEFVLPLGGEVWTSTVVAALGTLGVTERNARQALARLGDQDLIESERHGRTARWRLTPAGTRLLTSGAQRIYNFGARGKSWDGHWLVVMCPVAESERAKRHKLRTRLAFEGFGFAAPSVAVCPHRDREDAANAILRDLDLAGGAITLDARTGALTSNHQIIASAWELDSLAQQYRSFAAEFGRLEPVTPEDAFRAIIGLVGAWRHFPFRDPELPIELLPADWPGSAARELFTTRRQLWSAPAREWLLETESRVPLDTDHSRHRTTVTSEGDTSA